MLKIYIANLGKYNEGELVGKWVELPCEDLDEVLKEIEVVDGTAYEEYAIHDYESDIEGLNIGEYDNIFSLNEIAEKLNELSDYDKNWLEAYLDASGEDLLTALEQFEDNSYFYKDMTLEDVAEELVSEGCFGYIPDSIAIYIDYAAIARDLECDSYFETKQGVIYLCSSKRLQSASVSRGIASRL